MKLISSLLFAAFLLGVAGCGTMSANRAGETGTVCEVCRYNNDLACVCVKVTSDTPRTDYNGTTYYFCSDECKAAFIKKPTKYLAHH